MSAAGRAALLAVALACAAACGGNDTVRLAGETGGAGGAGGTGGGAGGQGGHGGGATAGWPPLEDEVPHWELSYAPEYQAVLDDLSRGREYVPGTFSAPGYTGAVVLRHRGDSARYHPKLSWKLEFPEGVLFEGRKKLNLMAEWLDRGFFTDKFNYDVMAAAGLPAPRARYVRLTVNGVYRGVFVEVEQVDKRFLSARGLDPDTSIYRSGANDEELDPSPRESWQWPWDKKTNEDQPWDEIYALEARMTGTSEAEFAAMLEAELELDLYLRYLAACALIGYQGQDQAGNYYLKPPGGARWTVVPWDLNNATNLFYRLDSPEQSLHETRSIFQSSAYDPYLQRQYENGVRRLGPTYRNVWSVPNTRIWDRPELRDRVLDHLEDFLATFFTEAEAQGRVAALWSLVGEHVAGDPHLEAGDEVRAPTFLAEWVAARRRFLETELVRARDHGVGGPRIVEVDPHAARLVIHNPAAEPLDLGGLTVTDRLREPFRHVLPAGLTVPAGGTRTLRADGDAAAGPDHLPFRLDPAGGELGLYDGVHRHGVLDLHYYVPIPAGHTERREPVDSERWVTGPPDEAP